MKKVTSSDKIKILLAEECGGSPTDWKRISKQKRKNGDMLRLFKNEKESLESWTLETTTGEITIHENYPPANVSEGSYRYFFDRYEYESFEKRWCIQFNTFDDNDPESADQGDTPPYGVLKNIFRKHYGEDIEDSGLWDIGAAENTHCCYMPTEDACKQRVAEIAWILEQENIRPDGPRVFADIESGKNYTIIPQPPASAQKQKPGPAPSP